MRLLAIAAALLPLLVAPTSSSFAGSSEWAGTSRGYGYHQHRYNRPSIGYTTPVSRIRGLGTFSRSVWAISRYDRARRSALAPLATIIHVDPSTFRSGGCSYEAGVCVVRADR